MSIVKKIETYVKTWEDRCYYNGIPDEVPKEINNKVPNYKKIAIALLNNDVSLKSLGLNKPNNELYYLLKKQQKEMCNLKYGIQLKMFRHDRPN